MITTACRHVPVAVAGLEVVSCETCGEVSWYRKGQWLDPAEGMAELFGQYDLVGRLEALSAPAPEVLLYRPPSGRWRSHLDAFPKRIWLEVSPELWLSHDDEHLLLAPANPLHMENLTRGA
ncbi:MAG: hypothetical protein HKN74_13965 [Acidimicrobiia bacterium]|nr:hypothetical protein [Acidimicrobiia bacterium]NNF11381.1 hypothetical protein [Acidimicrobiia bacterium]NNL68698.1 hypothetical protein [Acidimicrobiia bacterium]